MTFNYEIYFGNLYLNNNKYPMKVNDQLIQKEN